MFWWFERGGRYLRCEAQSLPSGGYELRLIDPEGSEQAEYFDDARDLTTRQSAVMDQMMKAGWNGPHGWVL